MQIYHRHADCASMPSLAPTHKAHDENELHTDPGGGVGKGVGIGVGEGVGIGVGEGVGIGVGEGVG